MLEYFVGSYLYQGGKIGSITEKRFWRGLILDSFEAWSRVDDSEGDAGGLVTDGIASQVMAQRLLQEGTDDNVFMMFPCCMIASSWRRPLAYLATCPVWTATNRRSGALCRSQKTTRCRLRSRSAGGGITS